MNNHELRPGFTVMEIMVAVGVLSIALVLVAEVGVWSLGERSRIATRQETLEQADNILESARAVPWEALTPDWAATQRLPESLTKRLHGSTLTVQVEPEPSHPHTKRVTVEIHWQLDNGLPARPVQVVSLFSARSAETTGGKS